MFDMSTLRRLTCSFVFQAPSRWPLALKVQMGKVTFHASYLQGNDQKQPFILKLKSRGV